VRRRRGEDRRGGEAEGARADEHARWNEIRHEGIVPDFTRAATKGISYNGVADFSYRSRETT
jgi:hypothetical protein